MAARLTVVGAALRDAVAKVPAVHRSPAIDGEVQRLGDRLQQLPWKAADATPAQCQRALAELLALLNEGIELARIIRSVPGYEVVAVALYGVVAGLAGAPPPSAAGEGAASPDELLAADSGAGELAEMGESLVAYKAALGRIEAAGHDVSTQRVELARLEALHAVLAAGVAVPAHG